LKGINVAFLSVYHTVDNVNHCPNSIHAQQLAILLREAREVTPQQAWQQDITESIQLLQAQKVEVVIAGDFNTAEGL
jgi:exonuclease III